MTHTKSAFIRGMFTVILAIALSAIAGPAAHAQTLTVLHNFTSGVDGDQPMSGLVLGPSGNFYGTTSEGGADSSGTIFELSQTGTLTTLYAFTGGPDGGRPEAAMVLVGNVLYGTTMLGGAHGNGTVFSLALTGNKETVLYSFTGGADGGTPNASLTRDSKGNLYSTTFSGGKHGNGVVFELLKPTLSVKVWTESVLYNFGTNTDDGAEPVAGVTFDKEGNLYGTTSVEGQYSYGNVYQLVPGASGWTENILHQFELLSDGGTPYAGIVLDPAGNLYGATTQGGQGGTNGGGTVFEISPNGSSWTFNTIASLAGWNISGSFRNLLLESESTIFGTTHCDGTESAGTIFKLTKVSGKWNYTQLYQFSGSDGQYLFANPVLVKGAIWGTTQVGGSFNDGVAFKLTLE